MNYDAKTDRELDALVAEKVLRVDEEMAKEMAKTWWPSTNVSDAFEVVEAMRERGYDVCIRSTSVGDWTVDFWGEIDEDLTRHESLPRAIVIAALRATDA